MIFVKKLSTKSLENCPQNCPWNCPQITHHNLFTTNHSQNCPLIALKIAQEIVHKIALEIAHENALKIVYEPVMKLITKLSTKWCLLFNMFMTSNNETTNSPIHELR